ncbi:MAG: PhzF family phenazine biosynthesis protein [Acidimicrobiia bacterium]
MSRVPEMRHCYIVRVFTRGDEGGNHLGVVTDSTGLSDNDMQAIAAELGFSETIFLSWKVESEPPTARIFTPTVELPFAGHPLVGACWVLSVMGPGGADRIICGIGEVSLAVEGEMAWVETDLDQRIETLNDPIRTSTVHGLPPARIARRVMMPIPYLLLELERPQDVASVELDLSRLDQGDLIYVCAWESETEVKARFFAPGVGVFEDPATGSAAVALAAALQSAGKKTGELEIHQGEEVGQPSTIHLAWAEGRARIGGTVRKDEVRVLDY